LKTTNFLPKTNVLKSFGDGPSLKEFVLFAIVPVMFGGLLAQMHVDHGLLAASI